MSDIPVKPDEVSILIDVIRERAAIWVDDDANELMLEAADALMEVVALQSLVVRFWCQDAPVGSGEIKDIVAGIKRLPKNERKALSNALQDNVLEMLIALDGGDDTLLLEGIENYTPATRPPTEDTNVGTN